MRKFSSCASDTPSLGRDRVGILKTVREPNGIAIVSDGAKVFRNECNPGPVHSCLGLSWKHTVLAQLELTVANCP